MRTKTITQLRMIPLKRNDLTTLDQLTVNDVFYFLGKPDVAYQVMALQVGRYGNILYPLVSPRAYKNNKPVKDAHTVKVVYLRSVEEEDAL